MTPGRALDQMGQTCQYLAKKADFGPNLAVYEPNLSVYGPKILIFMGVSKSFGTHMAEKPPSNLFDLLFWFKWARNADIWPKMPVLGPIGPEIHFLGDRVKLLVSS